MTAASRRFDEDMKVDHYILSSSANKRPKNADPRPPVDPERSSALPLLDKPKELIVLTQVDSSSLKARVARLL